MTKNTLPLLSLIVSLVAITLSILALFKSTIQAPDTYTPTRHLADKATVNANSQTDTNDSDNKLSKLDHDKMHNFPLDRAAEKNSLRLFRSGITSSAISHCIIQLGTESLNDGMVSIRFYPSGLPGWSDDLLTIPNNEDTISALKDGLPHLATIKIGKDRVGILNTVIKSYSLTDWVLVDDNNNDDDGGAYHLTR